MMRQKLLVLSIISVFLLLLSNCSDIINNDNLEDPIVTEAGLEIESEVATLVNNYRKSRDLSLLEMNAVIADVARKHSQSMANGETPFGHDGFIQRVQEIREKLGGSAASENVAFGYESAESAVNGWLNSSGHKKNIEGDYNLTGISVAYAEDGTPYYTQIFLKR